MKTALLYTLLTASLLGSCARQPISTSYWEGAPKKEDDVRVTYYDNDHKIRCTVSNDSTRLYVYFDTDNPAIMREVVKKGVTVFMDTTARKKELVFVEYPADPVQSGPKGKTTAQGPDLERQRQELGKMILNTPATLRWNNGKEKKAYDFNLDRSGFNGQITIDSLGYFCYRVTVPLLAITPLGYRKDMPLSVGVRINGGSAIPPRNSDGNEGMSGGGYGGRGSRGGMGAGMGAGGMRGGGAMHPGAGVGQEERVNFWITVQLRSSKRG